MQQHLTYAPAHLAATMLFALLLANGCSPAPDRSEEIDQDIVHTVQENGITVTLTLSPATVDPRQDSLLALKTRFPPGLQIVFPEPAAALEGFSVAATLTLPETRDQDGFRTRETELRLTPIPGAKYRIAPMLFEIPTPTNAAGKTAYLITPAIRPTVSRDTPAENTTLAIQPTPLYIPPTIAEIARWVVLALLAVGLLIGLYLLLRNVKRRIQILRMSPAERARYELQRLLDQDLPGKGQYREFYFAITSIIRTYIERRHHIRAPELTTPEFLAAAADRPAFKPSVVARLKRFLESADLVKFAAWTPTQRAIADTIETARNYIDQDEPSHEKEEN